jgi:ParB family chromosome partitioning protein
MSQPPILQLIPLSSIHPSPYQYRTQFDDAKQKELIESLRAIGLSTPILVRPRSPNEYELASGERRWRAAKELGWESIQAICEEMTDAEAAARVVTENEVRADTNVMEKAAGYKRLTQPPCSFTLEEIAKRYGYRSHTSVIAIIALLDQPAAIQEIVARATIGERHVRFLSRIKDLNARVKLAKRAAEEDWSVKETEKRVAKTLAKAGKGPGKSLAKDGPTHEYDYNGFHCKLVGDEVILSGRNYNRTKQSVKQFVADYQQALESFLRDLDAASAEQPAMDGKQDGGTSVAATEVAPPADLVKDVEAAGQKLKDIFSEIANKGSEAPGLSDLFSLFNKPRSTG